MCSPVKHFQCLEAASWLRADPSQSHVETPPPRCEWGNTWSQLLQPGSWVGFPAVSRRQWFTYSSVRTHPGALDSTSFPGITPPQKAVSTKHFPVASRSFSLKLSRVVVGGMLFLILEHSHILFKNNNKISHNVLTLHSFKHQPHAWTEMKRIYEERMQCFLNNTWARLSNKTTLSARNGQSRSKHGGFCVLSNCNFIHSAPKVL